MKKTSLLMLLGALSMSASVYADYVQPNIQHEGFGTQKVAYQMNTGDDKEQLQIIKYVNNHMQTVGKDNMEVQVVVFGAGISLLQSTDEKLNKAIDAIRANGVKIAVCNNTLRNKNIDWKTLYKVKETDIVPGGVAELAHLQQQKGFAYIAP